MEKKCCMSCIGDYLDDIEYLESIDFLNDIPAEFDDIANIYRTKDYIVCQIISMRCGDNENVIMSTDIYYRRTELRDEQYEVLFCDRNHLEGKRMPVSMYTRTYID